MEDRGWRIAGGEGLVWCAVRGVGCAVVLFRVMGSPLRRGGAAIVFHRMSPSTAYPNPYRIVEAVTIPSREGTDGALVQSAPSGECPPPVLLAIRGTSPPSTTPSQAPRQGRKSILSLWWRCGWIWEEYEGRV